MKKYAALTICSMNYMAKALVLLRSYTSFHPDHDFYLVIVDRKRNDLTLELDGINILWAEDLGIESFEKYAFTYDVIEFNTNIKPAALHLILQTHDSVVYLDPDIKIYSSLESVFDVLLTSSLVVTPHYNTPIIDGNKPDDLELLKFGAFNLGFIGVSNCDEAFTFLNWWSDRCLEYGFYEPQMGLGVDQKWVGLAPCFFPRMKILHDVGLNVAFWNLHERKLEEVNGSWMVNEKFPLKFIHFSSFNVMAPHNIAEKQTRFAPNSRSDFNLLACKYSEELINNSSESYSKFPYSFDYFDDGTFITPALRRFYAQLKNDIFFSTINPFAANGEVYNFAKKNQLFNKRNLSSHRHNFKDFSKYSFQIWMINKILRLALFILGPERYFNLMRYFSHISSLRNQNIF